MNRTLHLAALGMEASAIAFGTVRSGRSWFDSDADRMLGTYLEEGGNVIDTARVYIPPEPGCGEQIIGSWLHRSHRRQEIILMTKGGHPPLDDMHRSRLSPADMRADLEESLAALRTDWVDVYFYHRDDPSIPVEELLETMEQFVREGKIRSYACSNWTLPRMQAAEAYARDHGLQGFIGNQAMYNIGTTAMRAPADDTMVAADSDMLRYHGSSPCLLMPYSSLCNGYFHRLAASPAQVQGNKYDTPGNHRIFAHLRALCDRHGCTMTQAVLGYLLTQPTPMLPLCGASRPEQIRDMMGTRFLPLTAEYHQEV